MVARNYKRRLQGEFLLNRIGRLTRLSGVPLSCSVSRGYLWATISLKLNLVSVDRQGPQGIVIVFIVHFFRKKNLLKCVIWIFIYLRYIVDKYSSIERLLFLRLTDTRYAYHLEKIHWIVSKKLNTYKLIWRKKEDDKINATNISRLIVLFLILLKGLFLCQLHVNQIQISYNGSSFLMQFQLIVNL